MSDTRQATRARRSTAIVPPGGRGTVDTALAAAPALSALESPARFPFSERAIPTPHSHEGGIDVLLDRLVSLGIELSQRHPTPDQERRLEHILEGLYRDSRQRRTRGRGTARRDPAGTL